MKKQKYIIQGDIVIFGTSTIHDISTGEEQSYSSTEKMGTVYWSPWHGMDTVRFEHGARVYGSRSECKHVIRNHGCAYPDIVWKIKPLDRNGEAS